MDAGVTTKRAKRILAGALSFTAVLVVSIPVWLTSRERRMAELELAFAKIPIGATQGEADRLLGTEPSRSGTEMGVVATPYLFFAPENARAAQFGAPQHYTFHQYRYGPLTLVLICDQSGRVVCKTRDRRRPPKVVRPVFKALKLI